MLQIEAALFYYKLGHTLLQIGAALLLQIRASVVANWDNYYKLGKMYYKLGQVLPIRVIITNWSITVMVFIKESWSIMLGDQILLFNACSVAGLFFLQGCLMK